MSAPRRIALSGSAAAGMTTLCNALEARGWSVVPELGARVRAEGVDPVSEPEKYAERCLAIAVQDYVEAGPGECFFDRSILDAFAMYSRLGLTLPVGLETVIETMRYADPVILVHPNHEMYQKSDDRPQSFLEVFKAYQDMCWTLHGMKYRTISLPVDTVEGRVAWIEAHVAKGLWND